MIHSLVVRHEMDGPRASSTDHRDNWVDGVPIGASLWSEHKRAPRFGQIDRT
jgi:hypothetical protein